MRSLFIGLFFLCLILDSPIQAQNVLPHINVKNRDGKIIISWLNNYTRPAKLISIQRSFDSLRNFITIGSVLNPLNKENGFVDKQPINDHMYYRVFVAFSGGEYVYSETAKPEIEKLNTEKTVKPIKPTVVKLKNIPIIKKDSLIIAAPDSIRFIKRDSIRLTVRDSIRELPAIKKPIAKIRIPKSIHSQTTDASCLEGGSAILELAGFEAPFGITWNTDPVQFGPVANNLPPGNYKASIVDAEQKKMVYPISIALINDLTLTVHADTTIYSGMSFDAVANGNADQYSWTPVTGLSDPNIATPTVAPTSTTLYSIRASKGFCQTSQSFKVTVLPAIIHVFTTRENTVVISLPDADTKKYQLKFFDESGKFIFEINRLHDNYLIIDNANFVHAGWFQYEIFEAGKRIEKNKFYLSKEDKVQKPAVNEKGKKAN